MNALDVAFHDNSCSTSFVNTGGIGTFSLQVSCRLPIAKSALPSLLFYFSGLYGEKKDQQKNNFSACFDSLADAQEGDLRIGGYGTGFPTQPRHYYLQPR